MANSRSAGRDNPIYSFDEYSAIEAKAVTKSDTNDIHGDAVGTDIQACRAVYVGGAGNIAVKMAGTGSGGSAVTFTGVVAGTVLPIQIVQLMSTNTTATDVVALF